MRILVLGASGLVGREAVLATLRRGHHAVALGGTRTPNVPAGVESAQVDLINEAALERLILDRFPDAVINAAAMAAIGDCDRDPAQAERVNAAPAPPSGSTLPTCRCAPHSSINRHGF